MCLQLATLVIYANKTIVNLALKRLLNDRLLAKAQAPNNAHTPYLTKGLACNTSLALVGHATRLRFVAFA